MPSPSTESILEEMRTICGIEQVCNRKVITPFVNNQVVIYDAIEFEIPENFRPSYTSRKSTKDKCCRPAMP